MFQNNRTKKMAFFQPFQKFFNRTARPSKWILEYKGKRIDITGLSSPNAEPINEIILEERIAPAQIGKYKKDFHQNYIKQWAGKSKFSEIWSLREACIKALSK